jgi:hypothetical protein
MVVLAAQMLQLLGDGRTDQFGEPAHHQTRRFAAVWESITCSRFITRSIAWLSVALQ